MIDFNSITENWETVINLKLLGIIVSMRFPMMQLDSKDTSYAVFLPHYHRKLFHLFRVGTA